MDSTGTIGADCREEVLRLVSVHHILQFLAVAGEEDGSRAGSVAHADDVTLAELRSIRRWREGLVMPAMSR